ncbi:hypothetical protein I4U23_031156 [Adineta vaga]|nr:hypothetical protein I4U23_031156 [Adineta vaga]
MAGHKIKLQSNDGDTFDVEVEIAKQSATIKTMLEDLGMDEEEDVIPLPNVNSAILKKVIQWATHHKDDPPPPEDDENREKNTNDISSWDQDFLKVDQGTLFELILAANYLDIKGLLDVTCKTVANMIKGKAPEEIRRTFNIKNDFTPQEKIDEIHKNKSDMKSRPAIKNNLNEQLKIYYTYRDEAIQNRINYSENRISSQLTFRHIPDQPPLPLQKHRQTIPTQLSLSFSTKRDSTPLKKTSIQVNQPKRDTTPLKKPPIRVNHPKPSPPIVDVPSASSTPSTLPSTTYHRSISCSSLPTPTQQQTVSNTQCPICQIPFDTVGLHRPVNDACGHTTCFQCFKAIMIKATGCSLCQREEENEEELNPQIFDFSSLDTHSNRNQSNDLNHFEDALFDDWSLDQSSSSSLKKSRLKSIKTFDDNDDDTNDFETSNTIPSNEDDEECDKVTWISADVHDDGPEYRDKEFSHTKTMFERFHALFGLRKFRSNQQEAVNCALERRYHLFVLMPTGGGKSLCYQLPAVLDHGVTFVVSPLRSLILDQTQKLSSLGIPCAALTGDRTPAEVSAIYAKCYAPEPKLKLVYITPEKIGQSDQVNKLFSHLYMKNNLARFVIDEAHCISDWGHDFRPDYVKIGTLRERYPNIPFTLLTATATPRVQRDMLHQMKIERHLSKLFIQSFNRSNLVYKCFTKGKTDGALARTVQLCLSEQFVGLCGIVYCFSRAECERSAQYLSKSGVTAQAYHAGLEDQERANVQTQWANDEYQVICATIAFGMGIDKPNVRFVIHLSMPKSIEGYYQESGRAGRDGEQAYCYLFYCYQDLVKTKRLIMTEQSPNAIRDAKKVRLDNLHRVYAYCLNNVDCRRTLLLEYFGEQYLSSQCKKHVETRCDNCCSVAQTKLVDFTQLSKQILALVDQLTQNMRTATLNQVIDILKGSKQRAIKDAGHDQLEQFNIAEDIPRINLERLLSKLIMDGYLHQDISINDTYGTASAYIRLGKNTTFSDPITLSVCVKKENPNVATTVSSSSTRSRLVDSCLTKLKEELKSISSEYGIKYSTILSEKALKQMATTMPRTKEEMLRKTIEMTTIKYDLYKLDRLLTITCLFGSKLDEENQDDSMNTSLKRKREANTPTTSSYFQDRTNKEEFGTSKRINQHTINFKQNLQNVVDDDSPAEPTTATPRVQRDMLHQMKIERHLSKSFIQSFNRSNLVYKCFTKGKTDGALARTVQLCLSEQFVGLCGIVYCFSRAECERSAQYLSKSGVTAQAYHAGLEDQENPNVTTTASTNSTHNRLVDSCLAKLKDELKSLSSEYSIKYSTILSEKALKQMATTMPRTKEEMLRKTIEMTTIKYDLYKLDRLLTITCLFGSKLDEENQDDSMNTSLKRKREANTPTTSSYFQDRTNSNSKKKK